MKLVDQTIKVPAKVGKGKVKAAAKILVPEGHITPKELAKELKTSPKALRKVIRKLKMNRTGKCWHWSPNSPELGLIKTAYLKSIQPTEPKPAKKKASVTAAATKAVEALEAAEEDAPRVDRIDPAM